MSREKNAAMEALRARYPLGSTLMSNPDGLRWQDRMRASEAYFEDYSWDWPENQELLVDVRKLALKYGGYTALAYAIDQNFVADIYFRNPDPLIQDKAGDRDLSRMLSDVARAVHAACETERKMKEGFQDQGWAGFGVQYVSFRQEAEELADGSLVARKQQVIVKRMSPWRARFDPEGRDWDMTDHTWVAFLYFPTLAMLMSDSRVSDEDKARVMAFYGKGMTGERFDYGSVRYATMNDQIEDDPKYIRIPCWQIWARPEKKIYIQPMHADFTITPYEWPEEFAEEDCFPVLYMPTNREVEDKDGLRGFIGIPRLRLIKPHLLAIERLEALFLSANQNAIFKYISPKGALTDQEKLKLQSDRQRQVIEFDEDSLNAFTVSQRDKIDIGDILRLVPQPDLKELKHLAGIKHEMDMIAQIMGQSSGDRGGMPDTDTATDSAIIAKRLEARQNTMKHEAGKLYAKLTKLMFLVLKHRQELPIQYQMTTNYNEKVWATFSADKLRDLDLHFDYAVGSMENRTREAEFSLRERAAAIIMPFLQASGDVRAQMKLTRDLVEVLNLPHADEYFNDDVKDLMKQLIAITNGVQSGKIPNTPNVGARELELISMLGDKLLNSSDLAAIVAQQSGQAPPEQAGMGSVAKPPTPGERSFAAGAAGSAAAGAQGGMA